MLYTCGSRGAYALTRGAEIYEPSLSVERWTQRRGDVYRFLPINARDHVDDLTACSPEQLRRYLGPAPLSALPASTERRNFFYRPD
ncbi:MAG: hypothetical protein ACLSFJ_03340 [Holdemania filiformis]